MFDAADPILARLRAVATALPQVTEHVAHGRPNWRCGKQFAVYGGGPKGGDRVDSALLFVPDPQEAAALAEDGRFFVPAYYGPYGWLAVDLAAGSIEWDEVAELVDASYRQIAPKRAVAELDARD